MARDNTKKQEKNMNMRVIALFTLVAVPISAHSQTISQSRCTLKEADSPSVRGLRLGMSTQELLAVAPGIARRWAKEPKKIREAREKAMDLISGEPFPLSFEPATDAATDKFASKDQFAGVDSVSVVLYKGRVTDFTVVYVGAVWNTIDEWLAKVSESLRLPGPQEWVIGPSESPNKVLKCSGIEIEAAIQGGSSSITIRNTEYLKGAEELVTKGEEKKRREFKP
jgi:hypothetical protein